MNAPRDLQPGAGRRTIDDVDRPERDDETTGDQVIDLTEPEGAPEKGAQWDELHRRWLRWDEAAEGWVVLGDEGGRPVELPSDLPMSDVVRRELQRVDYEREHPEEVVRVIDVDRAAAPPQPVPGAQWNEVRARWERWDDVLEEWVEARAGASTPWSSGS